MRLPLKEFTPYILLFSLFVVACLFRPLMPIDETRYMTVAWEMYLNKNYLVPSLNFAPYHHKPPMLFWLINLVWNTFGVSRWAGLVPGFIACSGVMFLTRKLALQLFPEKPEAANTSTWILIGSVPFLFYGSLIMFDIMVSAIVLATFCIFQNHISKPRFYNVIAIGLLMGAGALTKGPVIYLYILCPLLLYPLWRQTDSLLTSAKSYRNILIAFVISWFPILAWLVPTLQLTDDHFAFWLLWEQTAGRITGNFSAAHSRPVYFYLLVMPLFFMPWLFLPSFWQKLKKIDYTTKQNTALLMAIIPAFLVFSLISGKQVHYLLPLLPFIAIFLSANIFMDHGSRYKIISITMISLTIAIQIFASFSFLKKYDASPFVAYYEQHRKSDWSFVRNYQGQFGFLGRIERPIESLDIKKLDDWLENHPDGYAFVRYYLSDKGMNDYNIVFSAPYQGKLMAVVDGKKSPHIGKQ